MKGSQVASEAKPFASLSSGLLARKGAARPAMRPQGFGQGVHGLEDLGWNDMGFEPPKPAVPARDENHDAFGEDVVEQLRAHPLGLTPVQSPVHQQQAKIVDQLAITPDEIDETAEPFEEQADTPLISAVSEQTLVEPARLEEVELQDVATRDRVPRTRARSQARARAPKLQALPGAKRKAAFTLRLDPERHLKLRLACAVDGRSAQQIVTHALDELLAQIPELESMAAKAKPKG